MLWRCTIIRSFSAAEDCTDFTDNLHLRKLGSAMAYIGKKVTPRELCVKSDKCLPLMWLESASSGTEDYKSEREENLGAGEVGELNRSDQTSVAHLLSLLWAPLAQCQHVILGSLTEPAVGLCRCQWERMQSYLLLYDCVIYNTKSVKYSCWWPLMTSETVWNRNG